MKLKIVSIALLASFAACNSSQPKEKAEEDIQEVKVEKSAIDLKLDKYVSVKLTTDISKLSDNQKKMIPILIEAAKIMDDIFWQEAYGDKESFLSSISDEKSRRFAEINYGPWDRLAGNEPFIDGVGPKPLGANYYPTDMSKEEFEAAEISDKASLYTLIRRDDSGNLISIPYHKAFETEVKKAAELLKEASKYADNAKLKEYLSKRAKALLTDNYFESDMVWMDMIDNQIDMIVGPIETYEDQLFGHKASHEAYILVKDMAWSERLAKYAAMLPELQKNLPVAEKYKSEKPGTDSQLAAFDVIYYAGDCNAGSKTIAVNLPNDEKIQLAKGTRRSQLKNAMQAKFDQILIPIANELIDESQRKYVNFEAFFANTMFHEVAHGLGIKNTLNGSGTVREALKEHASALEEGKADILGLYMVTQLHAKGELEGDIKEYYTTFMASIFRSVRFGTSSAHGKANMIRFNFFNEMGVFVRSDAGVYKINYEKMNEAMNALSAKILKLQGDGNYDAVAALVNESMQIKADLAADLARLTNLGIPVDVVFEQGVEVLGL
ncbi:MAG: Zn-dependent hydrolase [Bacteroidetes bacterium]|nr:MAG: Zn-dependent hydrolase [Bacteroidota bacterium]MBL1145221.1 Zn-dependent hydrolase [Bacteroidota bacterium]NOG58017.1 Zn-dependent hydrolase [Bacteroidota bacterium]